MSARGGIGVALSATAVAAIGAVGVWMGIAATSVPTVDLGDTVSDTMYVWSDAPDAQLLVEWRLRRDETVVITVRLAMNPDGTPAGSGQAMAVVELLCDARLVDPVLPDVDVDFQEGGSGEGCGEDTALSSDVAAVELATQTFTFPIDTTFTRIEGRSVRPWTASIAGQRTARSPSLVLGQAGGAVTIDATVPAPQSRLISVLEASPDELIDVMVTPSGEGVVQETSVTVQSDPGVSSWTDSVTWSRPAGDAEFGAFLPEGLARWTDPGAQTLTQLLLLLSGALIGVAASLAVERVVAWTLQVRGPGTPAAPQ